MSAVQHFRDGFRWDSVELLAYKEEGSHFKDITRQTLFEGREELPGQLRYFEIAPGGHSTLERHEHLHVVFIIRGEGEALIGTRIEALKPHDSVTIESQTWHQFRATREVAFGFLCLVHTDRDRPHRPDPQERERLLNNPSIAGFIRL